MRTVEDIKKECDLKQEQCTLLLEQKREFEKQITENREAYKKWLTKTFKNFDYDSSYTEVSDDNNQYRYTLEGEVLKMNKNSKRMRGCGGFFHPMEMMYMLEEKYMEKEEVVYEGNQTPKEKEKIDLFPALKEDLINKGEICCTIKKFLGEDAKMRTELRKKADDNGSEAGKIQNEINAAFKEALEIDFGADKLPNLFKNKITLVEGGIYKFRGFGRLDVKSITFKRETDVKYYLELVLSDGEEELLKVSKKDFYISKYLYL